MKRQKKYYKKKIKYEDKKDYQLKVVKKLKLEGSQSLTNRQRLALEASVSQLLKANKEASKMMMMSKYSNMEEKTGLLPQYNELNIKGR